MKIKAPLRFSLFAATLGAALQAQSAILNVCSSGCNYTTPSQAYASAQPGDTIQIQPGTYTDCIYILKNNLTIEGVNGRPIMQNRVCGQKGILVTAAQNLTIRSIELRGATNGSNYAGIRHDRAGYNLTLDNVYVHTNDMGLLASSVGDTITIRNSHFENNGMNNMTDGMAHNLYINTSASFNFLNSKSVRSKLGGHELKSRAVKTVVEGSTIATLSGNDSRLIDISNGGELIVRNSVLQKGTPGNNDLIGFGPEGLVAGRTNTVTITGNKVIADRSNGQLIRFFQSASPINISSNTLVALASVTNMGTPTGNTSYSTRAQAGYAPAPYLPAPAPSAPAPTPVPTYSRLRSAMNTGYCADTPSSTNGTQVHTWSCGSGNTNQRVEFNTTTGQIKFHGKCLDARAGTTGTVATVYDCNGGASQKWTRNSTTGEIQGLNNLCLGLSGTVANGAKIQVLTCNGSTNQKWSLTAF